MGFFKPTWKKVVYAIVFALFPYAIAFILVGLRLPDNAWGVAWFKLFVVLGEPTIWVVIPILPFNDDVTFFYVYPLLSFLIWLFILYAITFFIDNVKKWGKGLKR